MKEALQHSLTAAFALLLLFVFVLPPKAEVMAKVSAEMTEDPQPDNEPGLEPLFQTQAAEAVPQLLASPVISVWYDNDYTFGGIGNPQKQINILGNVRDPDSSGSIVSLKYQLNGGNGISLDIGPDGRRLSRKGDFNIAINTSDLLSGTNKVTIIAVDNSNASTSKEIFFNYVPGKKWPIPYAINWTTAKSLHEQAQVVDGLWEVTSSGLRVVQPGYDRVVAIGDMYDPTRWKDYEVIVPVTIHSWEGTSSDPGGVGVILRWQGHGGGGTLPDDWWVMGAYGYYSNRYEGWTIRINGLSTGVRTESYTESDGFTLNKKYIFKMKVETTSAGSKYSFKAWEYGKPEPAWDPSSNVVGFLDDQGGDLTHGSILLVAHKAIATFGNPTICTSSTTYSLSTSTSGGGSVDVSPQKSSYTCGEGVTLTAKPQSGWAFDRWEGDINSTSNPLAINMTRSYSNIRAVFKQSAPVVYDNTTYLPVVSR